MGGENQGSPRVKKVERGKDTAGHEFAGEVGMSERIAPPRPAPGPSGPQVGRGNLVPRPPRGTGPLAAPPPRAPDPSIAGSKYFTPTSSPPSAPRQLSSVRRERDSDSEAFDSTIDDDLGALTRRRDRERAAQAPNDPGESSQPPESGGGGPGKDLDAEARPRELDFSAPDMPRKRRSMGPM